MRSSAAPRSLCLLAALAALAACSADDAATPLALRRVAWNPADAEVGAVSEVVAFDGGVVAFGAAGATVLVGGVVVARHAVATSWRGAASIPAGDGGGRAWVVGVDGDGRVLRMRASRDFDDVSARYGLAGTPVTGVVALDADRAAFTVDGGFVVVDRASVTRYDGALPHPAGGARLASITAPGTVRVFDPRSASAREYALPGVTEVALDPEGQLRALTPTALYAQRDDGALREVYAGRALHGLAVSARGAWFSDGESLALYDGREARRAEGASVAADARLVATGPEGVWALSSGALDHLVLSEGVSDDELLWERTVRPVFARRRGDCHLAGGSANLDLSTYASWALRRASVRRRVVTEGSMPPDMSTPLTPDERLAVTRWAGGDAPAPPPTAGDAPTFGPVYEVLRARCAGCHGASGNLDLSSVRVAFAQLIHAPAAGEACGGRGERVVPGHPESSLLYRKLTDDGVCGARMPLNAPRVPDEERELIRRWIAGGANHE